MKVRNCGTRNKLKNVFLIVQNGVFFIIIFFNIKRYLVPELGRGFKYESNFRLLFLLTLSQSLVHALHAMYKQSSIHSLLFLLSTERVVLLAAL